MPPQSGEEPLIRGPRPGKSQIARSLMLFVKHVVADNLGPQVGHVNPLLGCQVQEKHIRIRLCPEAQIYELVLHLLKVDTPTAGHIIVTSGHFEAGANRSSPFSYLRHTIQSRSSPFKGGCTGVLEEGSDQGPFCYLQ